MPWDRDGRVTHYFQTPAGDPRDIRALELRAGGRVLTLRTAAGVFSRERVDPGTAVLLEVVPPPPDHGDLLDLGCGYGPIALTMALRSPEATVWAVDVNDLALELCAGNAAAAGLTNVRVARPHDVPPEVRFAALWSNPPIRVGKTVLHDLLSHWLSRLLPDAAAHLVVQRNLGSDSLHRWLDGRGWPTTRAASRAGYRVLRVGPRQGGGVTSGAVIRTGETGPSGSGRSGSGPSVDGANGTGARGDGPSGAGRAGDGPRDDASGEADTGGHGAGGHGAGGKSCDAP
jgi:16S rRNA (guanine1207-N2)-methyltransferase